MEISGIKYGFHHVFQSDSTDELGSIQTVSNDNLLYINKELKLKVKLRKVEISEKIMLRRKKLFEIMTFTKISKLKKDCHCENYEFNGEIDNDFEVYIKSQDYNDIKSPIYLKEFYTNCTCN